MLKLPEITYPLVVDTIGKMLATGCELSVYCCNQGCGRTSRVNLVQLARAKGMDFPSLAGNLKPLIYCAPCREAGRPDRNTGFIHHAPTYQSSPWPRGRK